MKKYLMIAAVVALAVALGVDVANGRNPLAPRRDNPTYGPVVPTDSQGNPIRYEGR